MRGLLLGSLLVSFLVAACSGANATGAGCPGTAPEISCQGCCGSTHKTQAACSAGAWVCPPDPALSCVICDGGGGDGAACTGTPPLICNGCCGSKYAADQCVNGAWTCQPRGVACVLCDAGTDAPEGDASGDGSAHDASTE